jgi:hypothetical protein
MAMSVRFQLERQIRQDVWERGYVIYGHGFWSQYSESVRAFQQNCDAVTRVLTNSEKEILKRPYSFGEPPALLFSGGLDSVFAHWWHNVSGLAAEPTARRLITLDGEPRCRRLRRCFPVVSIPAWWIGQVEIGGPFELISYGYGDVAFGGEDDGSRYDEEPRWPAGPLEMPDYSRLVWSHWYLHTGQKIQACSTIVTKVDMVKTLADFAPELLENACSCMNLASEGAWCGRCIKCLLMEVVYEAAGVRPPVRFSGRFDDESFRWAYQRRGVWDNIKYVLEPSGVLRSRRARKLLEFMKQFPDPTASPWKEGKKEKASEN